MTQLVFVDCETTSLRPDRRAWEIAIITREPWTVKHPDGPDTHEPLDRERKWLIHVDDLDLGNADPFSLNVGRFYDRHPQMLSLNATSSVRREADALREIERLTRGAHLVGAVVSFDADVLSQRMRAHGICPSWHYHLIDCEALAIGWLAHSHTMALERDDAPPRDAAAWMQDALGPPWKSDDLSAALGVAVSEEDRHTALGDARFARDIYDAVMGRPS